MQKGGVVNHHSSSTPQEYERQVTCLSEMLEAFYTFQKKLRTITLLYFNGFEISRVGGMASISCLSLFPAMLWQLSWWT